MDVDEEILSQFVQEANELLEVLSENLIKLEKNKTDKEVINIVFRAFHTIKGGAGFLGQKPLVDLCHRSENIFDLIRSGNRSFSSSDMDVFSEVLDSLISSFELLANGPAELPYPAELISALDAIETISEDDKAGSSAQPELSDEEALEALFDELVSAPKINDEPAAEVTSAPPSPEPPIEAPPVNEGAKKPSVTPPEPPKSPQNAKPEAQIVRVGTDRIDAIVNLVGELVLNRNRLKKISSDISDAGLDKGLSELDFIASELQSAVMKTRMQPVKRVFQRFPRVVRDIARSLGKKVDLVFIGEDTELDKNLVDALADPLMHMVRNSVDHGIEDIDVRLGAGKQDTGTLTLQAETKGDTVEIIISDDGKGIDPNAIRDKCIGKGLLTVEDAANMSDKELMQLVFMPGFSTASSITDLSGRGVGLDVVKTGIEAMNGTVFIDSKLGVGTVFTLSIPMTMTVLQTLMIESDSCVYAIPLSVINEIYIFDEDNTNIVSGQLLSRFKDGTMPVFHLSSLLPVKDVSDDLLKNQKVVVVTVADKSVGFVVDNVVGQEEVVIKPLGAFIASLEGYMGATITGGGDVALILDTSRILNVNK
ncbi:chemotaxis protein CheA [Pseudoalteromonas marina]|uniref:histidine kinase n=1 Tax=Pseudoalteromonas marina TaxID=267375 RepID=A0ABT9FC05_9GAMM|nr:chemotaxis protein CheA [Pseudoalteromonas marina]MDP2564319.1 chemotaxis protein CheA [Pseudoalteromonas marina]